jgi:hypothetical protein
VPETKLSEKGFNKKKKISSRIKFALYNINLTAAIKMGKLIVHSRFELKDYEQYNYLFLTVIKILLFCCAKCI